MNRKVSIAALLSIAISIACSSMIGYAFDYSPFSNTVNGRDAYYVQNEISKPQSAGRGSEYIDPMTGSLTLTQTDLVLPGKDGLDLRLERYYNSAQAEYFGKSAQLKTTTQNWIVPTGMYIVEVDILDWDTNQTTMYYYPYDDYAHAAKRKVEVENRDTQNGRFMYGVRIMQYQSPTEITLPYHYTSKTEILNYQRMRYNLGAGWAFSFPSVQLIKDDPLNYYEKPKGIYYHAGNGGVFTVMEDSMSNYYFENYYGSDYEFYYYEQGYLISGATSVIYYTCKMQDGTTYHFGSTGQIAAITDNYDNKILFHYTTQTFYGRPDCRLIAQIVDTVGRKVNFSYIGAPYAEYHYINVTVTHPSTTKVLTMQYQKLMIEFEDENVMEPILIGFTNTNGEQTQYLPVTELINWEEKYITAKPVLFTFTDKEFNAPMVATIGDIAHSWIYLLGEVRYPHSRTYYYYGSAVTRNLGASGVTQAHRVYSREDMELSYNEATEEIKPKWSKNYRSFSYSDTDYTGYPYYPSTETIQKYNAQVLSTEWANFGEITRFYQNLSEGWGADSALLLVKEHTTANDNKANEVNIVTKYSEFSNKLPSKSETEHRDKNNNLLFTTYQEHVYYADPARYNKLQWQTKPLLLADFNNDTIKDRHRIHYDYDENNGKLGYRRWQQNAATDHSERYYYDGPNGRLDWITQPESNNIRISYTTLPNTATVSKRTITHLNIGNYEKTEEYYTDATGYAYPSEIRKYYTDSSGNERYRSTFYTYDMLRGLVKEEEDNDGNVTKYEYDDLFRLTKATRPIYHTYGSVNDQTLPVLAEQTVEYGYAAVPYPTAASLLVTRMEKTDLTYYDNTDPANKTQLSVTQTENYYNSEGKLVRNEQVDNVNGTDQWIIAAMNYYDSMGLLQKTVDALGNETLFEYDAQARVVKTVDCYGNYYINQYDIPRAVPGYTFRSFFVAAANISGQTYSDAGRESITETDCDIWGQAVEKCSYSAYPAAYVTERFDYDMVGNMTGYIDPKQNVNAVGFTTTSIYDGVGRLKSTKNAKDEITRTVYDQKNNVLGTFMSGPNDPEQRLFTKVYDPQGRLKSNKDALAKTQTYEYNSLGLLAQSIDRNGTYFLYDYDEIGNITNSTAINDYGIEYRNKVVNPHGPGVVWDIYYVPSGGGYSVGLQGITDNIHSPAGRLLQKFSEYAYNTGVADNFTAYQNYRYDKLGRVSRSLAGNVDNVTGNIWGSYTNYVYNKTRLEKVQLDDAGALNPADSANAKYAFYPDGKLKSVTFPPMTDGSILKSEYTYDGLGRLDTLTILRAVQYYPLMTMRMMITAM